MNSRSCLTRLPIVAASLLAIVSQAPAGAQEDCSGSEFRLGFAAESVQSDRPFDGVVGGESMNGEIEILAGEGVRKAHVYAAVVSDSSPELGPMQGWLLSIVIDGEADCADAVSDFDRTDGGGASASFEVTECVDPAKNDGRRGVVSAVVVGGFVTLPLVHTTSVVDITLATDGPQGAADQVAVLRYEDGLRGGGQPVSNLFTAGGESWYPCERDDARLTVRFRSDGIFEFIRGDANADGHLDVSDPVTILRTFFHGDTRILCDDAADTNDDGVLDVSDAIYAFGYLFVGTAPPRAPFPEAGNDPTPDALRCRPNLAPTE